MGTRLARAPGLPPAPGGGLALTFTAGRTGCSPQPGGPAHPQPCRGDRDSTPGCRAGCAPRGLPVAQTRTLGGCRPALARCVPKDFPQDGETEAGAGAVPICRCHGRPRRTFRSWRARHGPRRFPRAGHAGRGDGGQAGVPGRAAGRGGPARRSHIREGGSPFPGVFQDPSGPGSWESHRRLQPSCHGSAWLRPSLPAPAGTTAARQAPAGCWHPCPWHRGAAGGPAHRGVPAPQQGDPTPRRPPGCARVGLEPVPAVPRSRDTAASAQWGCQSLLVPGTRGIPCGQRPPNPTRGAQGTPTPLVAVGPSAVAPSQPPVHTRGHHSLCPPGPTAACPRPLPAPQGQQSPPLGPTALHHSSPGPHTFSSTRGSCPTGTHGPGHPGDP